MTTPPEDRQQVPAYVALVRIGAVVGMSAAGAFGLFLIVGGWWWQGLISIALATPFFAVMRFAENTVEPPEPDG